MHDGVWDTHGHTKSTTSSESLHLIRAYHEDPEMRDPFLTLLNLPMDTIQSLCIHQLMFDEQVVIAADVRMQSDRQKGELLLKEPPELWKRDAIAYRQINACHVMSIDGVKLNADGLPVLWRVQDSHGLSTGGDGHYRMDPEWFAAFGLSAVIKKDFLANNWKERLATPTWMPKSERF